MCYYRIFSNNHFMGYNLYNIRTYISVHLLIYNIRLNKYRKFEIMIEVAGYLSHLTCSVCVYP